jgi:sulfite exporter TauE/SafE
VDSALIASAALLGLAGAPHCAAMCGAPCAALVGRQPAAMATFHVARVASYAAGGALAAGSVGALLALSGWSPALRPIWAALHVAALSLGAWLLWTGRQPAWMARIGRRPAPATAGGWQTVTGPLRAAAGGSLWVAWPCGLLQSALLVASMGSGATAGAVVMAGFALSSAAGLWAAPWALNRALGGVGVASGERWAVRAAGALLLAGSGWALGHGVWQQVAAFCGIG